MTVEGNSLDETLISFDTESSIYIGGVDKLLFGFTWRYDDPEMADDDMEVRCNVMFEMSAWPPLSKWNVMYPLSSESIGIAAWADCEYVSAPAADPILMGSDEGFISLHATEDNMIEGYVSLEISRRNAPGETPIFISSPFETDFPEGY